MMALTLCAGLWVISIHLSVLIITDLTKNYFFSGKSQLSLLSFVFFSSSQWHGTHCPTYHLQGLLNTN